MMVWDVTKAYLLTTLRRDMTVAIKLITSKKLQACVTLLGLMSLTVLVNLLVMWAATGSLPSLTVNTEYWGLAFQRVATATPGDLPATLFDTMLIYWDYPAIWFTFERVSFAEQARTLVMDTTVGFPVINIRYLVSITPIALLLTIYMILSRHRAMGMRAGQTQKSTQIVSISVPSGSSALGSALVPMACCGGTAVQSVASVMGFVATAPAAILFSRLSVIGVTVWLVIGIARTARKLNSACC